jgi:diacylglycerol kinase family enzyme
LDFATMNRRLVRHITHAREARHLPGTWVREAGRRRARDDQDMHTAPAHPMLIVNPRSGGGKAEHFGLVRECRARGIEPLVFEPGDDLREIATSAVSAGADAIGVAGGDGSQAIVAEIASAHDIPYVCVPAGTRNHFANDLGVDRRDVIGALNAFADGSERRIDLARVNGRMFINNASLGVYAAIVQSSSYRDAKLGTVARQLPDLLPPRRAAFDLHFTAPDGTQWSGAHLVLVSNNPYRPPRPGARGTREGINQGVLGVIAVRVVTPSQLPEIRATESTGNAPRVQGSVHFTTPRFVVDASDPVEAALDGEALVLEPPLRFESLPGALRVRVMQRGPARPSHLRTPQSRARPAGT